MDDEIKLISEEVTLAEATSEQETINLSDETTAKLQNVAETFLKQVKLTREWIGTILFEAAERGECPFGCSVDVQLTSDGLDFQILEPKSEEVKP